MRRTESWVQSRRLKQSAGIRSPKFTEEQKLEICRWIAHFMPIMEVARKIRTEWQMPITDNTAYHFERDPKWQPVIDRLRADWVRGIMKEPIANKRTRLQHLAKLIESAEKDTKSSAWRQRAEIAKYLDQARLEMDENKTGVTNLFLTQVNNLNEAELVQRRDQLLERIKQWRPSNVLRVGHTEQGSQASGDSSEASNGGTEAVGDHSNDRPVEGKIAEG